MIQKLSTCTNIDSGKLPSNSWGPMKRCTYTFSYHSCLKNNTSCLALCIVERGGGGGGFEGGGFSGTHQKWGGSGVHLEGLKRTSSGYQYPVL